jgi:hypothetical protein
MVVEVFNVGITLQHPQQFVNNGFQVKFFRRQQGKTIIQGKPHLVPENGYRSGASSIALSYTALQHMSHHFQILLHQGPPDTPSSY